MNTFVLHRTSLRRARRLVGPLVAAALVAVSAPAAALQQTYSFSQSGFSGGGSLSGSFVVEDLNGDGEITAFYGELLAFSLQFAGDAFVPDFRIGLDELYGMTWRLGSAFLGDELLQHGVEGLKSDHTLGLPFAYASGLGPTHLVGGYAIDLGRGLASFTAQPIAVSAVPEPGMAALWAAGLGLLAWSTRRVRRG